MKKEKKALELKKIWVAMGASVVLASQMMIVGGAAAEPAKPAASSEASPAVQPKVEAGVEQKGEAGRNAGGKQNSEGKKNTEGKQNAEAKRNDGAKPKDEVMTDNLSKYGLKKDMELPVTVEAGGLSYTLHKVMIYDFNSKDAVALKKRFDYPSISALISKPKYFVWTKITIKNKTKKTIDNMNGRSSWVLQPSDKKEFDPTDSFSKIHSINDKEALNTFKLKPGESLTTYQALYYDGNFDYFAIRLYYGGQFAEKFLVSRGDTRG